MACVARAGEAKLLGAPERFMLNLLRVPPSELLQTRLHCMSMLLNYEVEITARRMSRLFSLPHMESPQPSTWSLFSPPRVVGADRVRAPDGEGAGE